MWQGKDDWEAFEHDRLHPVVHPLLHDMLGFVPPEPPKTVLDVVPEVASGPHATLDPKIGGIAAQQDRRDFAVS